MIVQFDGKQFDRCTVGVEIDRDYELDKWGRPWLEKQTWTLNIRSRKASISDPASSLVTAIESVFDSLVSSHVRIIDDNGAVAQSIEPGTSLGGVRLIRGPSYPKFQNGELASFRTAKVVLEATLPRFTDVLRLIDADETITGRQMVGPVFAVLQPNVGDARMQQIRERQHANLVQSGYVVYAGAYGEIPPPVLEVGQLAPPEVVPKHPRIIGGGNGVDSAYVEYRIDYTYHFASNVSLVVLPTRFTP